MEEKQNAVGCRPSPSSGALCITTKDPPPVHNHISFSFQLRQWSTLRNTPSELQIIHLDCISKVSEVAKGNEVMETGSK